MPFDLAWYPLPLILILITTGYVFLLFSAQRISPTVGCNNFFIGPHFKGLNFCCPFSYLKPVLVYHSHSAKGIIFCFWLRPPFYPKIVIKNKARSKLGWRNVFKTEPVYLQARGASWVSGPQSKSHCHKGIYSTARSRKISLKSINGVLWHIYHFGQWNGGFAFASY